MAAVGALHLLVIGFAPDSPRPVPRRVLDRISELGARSDVELIDLLGVTCDVDGVLHREPLDCHTAVHSVPPGSTLWQLLQRDDVDTSSAAPFTLLGERAVGIDLERLEDLSDEIAPTTSAVLLLVELTWMSALLETAMDEGGSTIVSGLLEPETMLVIGPQVALAIEARDPAAPN